MDDLISRQAAIEAASKRWGAIEALEAIHAADVVQVVHGEWKPHEDKQVAFGLTFECSCCGSIVLVNDALEFGYCPYCGVKMDGERKE